jgi:hypothetical protein
MALILTLSVCWFLMLKVAMSYSLMSEIRDIKLLNGLEQIRASKTEKETQRRKPVFTSLKFEYQIALNWLVRLAT